MSYVMVAAVATLFTLPAPALAQANLVTNGGFETGDFTGFTQFGNTGATRVDTYSYADNSIPNEGSFVANFGPVGSTGGISQDIATVAGRTYNISFVLNNNNSTPNSFSADFGDTNLVSFSNASGFGYILFPFKATATSALTTLSFTFRQDPSYFSLDNIQVTAAGAVPEPATWTMMLMGFGIVGFGLRASRRGKVATKVAYA